MRTWILTCTEPSLTTLESFTMPLTSAHACAVIEAAEGKASALGVSAIVAVVDAGVHLKAFTRMDGAVTTSIPSTIERDVTAISEG